MWAALDQLPQVCDFGILLRAYRSGKQSGRGSWVREGSSLRCFVLTGVRSRFLSAELMSRLGQREAEEHGTGTKETCPPSPQSLSTSSAYPNPLCSTFWMSLTSDLHPAHPHLGASITDLGEMLPLLFRGTAGNCARSHLFLSDLRGDALGFSSRGQAVLAPIPAFGRTSDPGRHSENIQKPIFISLIQSRCLEKSWDFFPRYPEQWLGSNSCAY